MAFGSVYDQHSEQGEAFESGLELVQKTGILGRKRVAVANCLQASCLGHPLHTPLKRLGSLLRSQSLNRLDLLPQDILVKILCKVNHSDLKRLVLVSKSVNEATLIAKESHFAFSTPSSKKPQSSSLYEEFRGSDADDCSKGANAPKQRRVTKSLMDGKRLSSIAVVLFASPEAE